MPLPPPPKTRPQVAHFHRLYGQCHRHPNGVIAQTLRVILGIGIASVSRRYYVGAKLINPQSPPDHRTLWISAFENVYQEIRFLISSDKCFSCAFRKTDSSSSFRSMNATTSANHCRSGKLWFTLTKFARYDSSLATS